MTHVRRHRILLAPAMGLLLAVVALPVQAQAPEQVVHRASILTELSPTGVPGTSRVFTQLTIPAGSPDVVLPRQSTTSLRGLSGPEPTIAGEDVRFTGSGAARMVANNTAPLPISIEVSHDFDGEQVNPDDLVGRDGQMTVSYTVRNMTAEPTELTLVDGHGDTSTRTVDVAVPMVGSLMLTLPSNFDNVRAPGAVVVGDGRGGTIVNWSLVLFSPIGSETAELSWTADVTDAFVPGAAAQVLPVTPDSFPSFGATQTAYRGAVDSTMDLTAGALEIDANVLRLAGGASQLLAGLLLLRNGAQELSTGLVDAADGAAQISAGLAEARDGGGDLAAGLAALQAGALQLASGSSDLAAGAGQLDANTAKLAAGSGELAGGAADLRGGLGQLASGITGPSGLPAAVAGLTSMIGGIGNAAAAGTLLNGITLVDGGLAQLQDGIGSPGSAGTLRDGVDLADSGLSDLDLGLQQLAGGISNPACDPTNPTNPGNPCGLTQGIEGIEAGSAGLSTAIASIQALLESIDETTLSVADQATLATVIGSIGSAATAGTILNGLAVIEATAAGLGLATADLLAGIGSPAAAGSLRNGVATLQGGMAQIDAGLVEMSNAIGSPAAAGTLRNGVALVTGGVSNPAALSGNPTCNPAVNPANPCGLLEGIHVLQAGLSTALAEASTGLGDTSSEGTLLWGADQVANGAAGLRAGADRLVSEGTGPLAAGAGEVAVGASQLADGAAEAAGGGSDLADGLQQLDEGAGELAAGLVDAREGSGEISDGLQDAHVGGTEIAAGTQRLSAEGTAVLAGEVSGATIASSLQLELLQAAAARGVAGDGMPYPTVDGATASAVYQFDLAGVADTAGPGLVGRSLIGLGLLGLALLAWFLTRQRMIQLPEIAPSGRVIEVPEARQSMKQR